MPFTVLFRASGGRNWLFGGLLLAVPLLLGAGYDYLREIEEEAKRQAATLTTSQGSSSSAATLTSSGDTLTERLSPGLEQAEFEQVLRSDFAGTYAFYQRLDTAGKQQVYEAYQKDNRLSSISEQVTRLLGGGKP